MKNLVQFQFKIKELFFNFSQPNAENKIGYDELISGLRGVENLAKEATKRVVDGDLWWRFFKGDNLANTISGLEIDLSLPASHRNHQYAIECMKMTSELENDMEIYYS